MDKRERIVPNFNICLRMIQIAVLFLLIFSIQESEISPVAYLLMVSSIGLILYDLLDTYRLNKLISHLILTEKNKEKPYILWDKDEEEKLRLLKKRVEVSALQSQINPHFLYNTLDSIRSKAIQDQQLEIASMTEILSKFFRYCISNDGALVKIKEELNHIKDYYYIQKYRFEERISMEIEVENEEVNDLYIPRMSLQPIVENAMIHGLEKMSESGKIKIHVIQTEEKVVIYVKDNGVGMNPDKLELLNKRLKNSLYIAESVGKRHNGIALMNVNARIKLTFGEMYGISYRSLENAGTDAVIKLPKIDEFERVRYENIVESGR